MVKNPHINFTRKIHAVGILLGGFQMCLNGDLLLPQGPEVLLFIRVCNYANGA